MKTNLDQYKNDLKRLKAEGKSLLLSMHYKCSPGDFKKEFGKRSDELIENLPDFKLIYQSWYSEAKILVKQVLPSRLSDFESHYKKPNNRKELTYESYRIEDYLQGLLRKDAWERVTAGPDAAIPHLTQQLAIIDAASRRFESSLFDIKQLLQSDVFDTEIQASRELLKKGFLRAAGAVAGVVLEKHFSQVTENHSITIGKKNPAINDYNEILKNNNIIDIPTWRQIQRLGDIRNYCDHNKDREPTKEEVLELIDGVDKFLKTLF